MDKKAIIEKVKKISPKFKEIGEKSFSMNGLETNTLVFEYEGSEFVFVEGKDNVELGWDYNDDLGNSITEYMKNYSIGYYDYLLQVEKDITEDYTKEIEKAIKNNESEEDIQQIRDDLEDELEFNNEEKELYENPDLFVEKFKTYLNECTSPVRKANIKSMLVETDNQYLKKAMTYDEVIEELNKTIFRLPTEDEWEYICSGGKRTIFRWGNIFNEDLDDEISPIGTGKCKDKNEFETIIDKPNMFGVYISYNPYKYEIIDDETYLKGGDGGCSICGGDGPLYVLPCFSSFYRYKKTYNTFDENYYTIRRVVSLD